MKKLKVLFFTIICSLILFGCNGIAVNEIYNKSYHIGKIELDEFEELIVAAVEKVNPAVVGVSNYQGGLLGEKLIGTGSGVVYSCSATLNNGTTISDCSTTLERNDVSRYNYLVVTNRHVILNSDTVKIYIGPEDIRLDAELIQYDDKVDLAVVKFSHYKYIQPIEFADSDTLKSGNFAIAIGNPSGYEFYGSSTFGIISFPKRYLADDTDGDGTSDWDAEYIQHDVAINPGNSGGALIDIKGQLIGINTLKILSNEIDNMGFAIPSNVVREIIKILETGKKPERRTLGISIVPVKKIINPEDYQNDEDLSKYSVPSGITSGLYVVIVENGHPADNYLFSGDIILKINGVKIFYTPEFRAQLSKILVGETAIFTVYRDNKEIEVSIPL